MKSHIGLWVITLGILGALSVMMGAFGAHMLGDKLSESSISTYETAVFYQFMHVLAGFVAYLLYLRTEHKSYALACKFFVVGIVLFSGSLYLLSMKELLHITDFTRILGPITPLGGLFFIVGWIFLTIGIIKSKV